MPDKSTKSPEHELTTEEQHRKAWLHHALQTPQPRREIKEETLLSKIISLLQDPDLS